MKAVFIATVVLAIFASAVIFFNQPQTSKPSPSLDASQTEAPLFEIIVQNLEVPWALAFLPDGSILVTERAGTVKLVKDGKTSAIANIKVKQIGESGLHGIAIHPKYPNPSYVYLYYTYSADNNNSQNKVSRFTFDGQTLKDEQVIVDKIPGALFHDGGRIKFGPASTQRGEPDGYLYITTGDAQNPSLSQN